MMILSVLYILLMCIISETANDTIVSKINNNWFFFFQRKYLLNKLFQNILEILKRSSKKVFFTITTSDILVLCKRLTTTLMISSNKDTCIQDILDFLKQMLEEMFSWYYKLWNRIKTLHWRRMNEWVVLLYASLYI